MTISTGVRIILNERYIFTEFLDERSDSKRINALETNLIIIIINISGITFCDWNGLHRLPADSWRFLMSNSVMADTVLA